MSKSVISKRYPVSKHVDPAILGQQLHFKASNRTAKNRFYKAAMSELMSSFSLDEPKKIGIPSNQLINLYEKFAYGEFGVIATGNIIIDHLHLEAAGNMVISKETESAEKDRQFKRLTTTAKSTNGFIIAQLNHCGRQTPAVINSTPFSASDHQLNVRIKGGFRKPKTLNAKQIKTEVVDRFVYAAVKCYQYGFDGCEIHAAHGFLLSQFLSPTTNTRTDKYGGNADNRSRIIEEIYQEIRTKIPASTGFIVGIKLNSADSPQSGSLEDVTFVAKKLDSLGFDYIELSGGSFEKWTLFHYKESTKQREAFFVEFAAAIKPYIKNSIIYLTGGFRSAPAMVSAVKNGDCDGVGIAKPSAAEPDLPLKILENRVQSSAFNPFEFDYGVANLMAQTQMWQASKTAWSESNGNPCFGISDFSEEHENF
ncbi:Oxidored-FMN domain-containing protein [Aphelenchoides bicaudatus]|nr:Oxidored-FMN domain-containing protein [Aphelenchoides bicaudatus]